MLSKWNSSLTLSLFYVSMQRYREGSATLATRCKKANMLILCAGLTPLQRSQGAKAKASLEYILEIYLSTLRFFPYKEGDSQPATEQVFLEESFPDRKYQVFHIKLLTKHYTQK